MYFGNLGILQYVRVKQNIFLQSLGEATLMNSLVPLKLHEYHHHHWASKENRCCQHNNSCTWTQSCKEPHSLTSAQSSSGRTVSGWVALKLNWNLTWIRNTHRCLSSNRNRIYPEESDAPPTADRQGQTQRQEYSDSDILLLNNLMSAVNHSLTHTHAHAHTQFSDSVMYRGGGGGGRWGN